MQLLCTVLILVLLVTAEGIEQKTEEKPHIVFILADDLGFDDVSFHGSNQIPTPNIDKLANTGVILNNYYVQHICTPTRAALMSGRYPIHTGMHHGVIKASCPYGLGLDEILLPQNLKELGYATHGVGKWHLGFFKFDYTPTRRGFDTFFGYWCAKGDYWDHSEQDNGWGLDLHNGTEPVWIEWGEYSTELYTNKAVDVIQSHDQSKPLFLYLAHQAVHSALKHQPLQAPESFIKKFNNISDPQRKIYAAMVTALDESVGKVADALKAKGMYNNSIIVFSTDNGGPAAGFDLNMASNYPLRGMKHTMWEGGVRGAGFIHSPLFESTGRVSMDMMHVTDWLPTLYVLAGGDIHKLQNTDGYDMSATLSVGKPSPRNEILHNIDPFSWQAGLRFGNWKLVVNESVAHSGWYPPPGYEKAGKLASAHALKNAVVTCNGKPPAVPAECTNESGPCLFNIQDDPCEYTNMAEKEPETVQTMLKLLEKYKQTMVPPRDKPHDPASNPKKHGGVWTAWED